MREFISIMIGCIVFLICIPIAIVIAIGTSLLPYIAVAVIIVLTVAMMAHEAVIDVLKKFGFIKKQ